MRYLIVFVLLLSACGIDEKLDNMSAKVRGQVPCGELQGECKPICEKKTSYSENMNQDFITANVIVKHKGKNAGEELLVFCPQNKDCCIPSSYVFNNFENFSIYHFTSKKAK